MNKSIASTQGQKNKRYSVKKTSIAHFFVSQSRLTDAVSVILSELLSYEHPSKERGFFVRALNLLDPAYSDSFNCLADVEEDAGLVNIIADTIIATTSSKFEKSDFWAKAEKNLLMALIWYVVLLEDPETHKRLPIQAVSYTHLTLPTT